MRNGIVSLGLGATLILGAVDTATLNETALQRVEIIAENRVVAEQIGNVVKTTFPWKDQPGFTVSFDMGEPTLAERLKDKRSKEVITETVSDFDGGFKVDILLNEKPNTNKFCYTIENADQYDFLYQTPLTETERANGLSRPENIDGSYAVYHKTLRDNRGGQNDYATGKVLHIPRPQVWSMSDVEKKVWADMTYEAPNLCVTVPQSFLDEAKYPVRVDPTFGYTSVGASREFLYISDHRALAIQQSLPEAGTIYSINAAMRSEVTNAWYKTAGLGALYSTSGNLLSTSTELWNIGTTTGAAWYEFGFLNGYATTSQTLWLVIGGAGATFNLNEQGSLYYDADASVVSGSSTITYPTINNSLTFGNDTDRKYSVYATYCVSTETCGPLTITVNATSTTHYWTPPTNVSTSSVACWGGGGGGADGGTSGAASGGGGAYAQAIVSVVPGNAYAIVAGNGGAQTGAGVDSTFGGTLVIADAGTGGVGATANGLGGTTANSSGTVEFAGGDGNDGNAIVDVGAGGGGSGGPSGAGAIGEIGQGTRGGGGGLANGTAGSQVNYGVAGNINGRSGTSTPLGANGGGGAYDGALGGYGGIPGGGGGGGEATGRARGGSGQCTIQYTIAASSGGGGGDAVAPEELYFLSYSR